MPKQEELFAERTTHLAEKRTELAYERTMLSYLRTAATLILFGLGFLGLSEVKGDFFNYTGIAAIIVGATLLLFSIRSAIVHSQEIKKVKDFFENLVKFRFKKEE